MRTTITRTLAATGLTALALVPFGLAPSAGASTVPACTSSQLSASYHGGDAGMSHVFGRIVEKNTSQRACSIHGYGGLSYVGGGAGTQVGAAADRDPGTPVRTIVLQPGEKAKSKLSEARYDVFPAGLCDPTAVDGFRVYVPDSTRSQYIAHPTTACTRTESHQLTHQAFRRP